MDRNGWYAKPLPVEHWQDEKTVRFGVDAAEAPEYFEKKLKRLQKEFGEDVTLEGAEERTIENPEVEFNMTIDATLWPRFGAKNGLGFGREIFGEEWLSGPVASYLRDVLWGRDAVPPAPYAPLAPVSESLHETELDDYFERPLHVVTAMGTSHGAALGLFLFGDQRYLVPLGGELGDDVEGTWIVDPRNGTARRLSWSQYAQETAVRLVHAAEGGDSAEP
ncbi:MAG: hypothetical protein QOI10_3465 [Solirubrobacterales bacterium]|nr:hypothetical protein [Solirubrobacterales bacterium]